MNLRLHVGGADEEGPRLRSRRKWIGCATRSMRGENVELRYHLCGGESVVVSRLNFKRRDLLPHSPGEREHDVVGNLMNDVGEEEGFPWFWKLASWERGDEGRIVEGDPLSWAEIETDPERRGVGEDGP